MTAHGVVREERLGFADQGLGLVIEGSDAGDGGVDPQHQVAIESLLRHRVDAHRAIPFIDVV